MPLPDIVSSIYVDLKVGGRLRCIGSPQHLKTRFGNHLELEVFLFFLYIFTWRMGVEVGLEVNDILSSCFKILMSVFRSLGQTC